MKLVPMLDVSSTPSNHVGVRAKSDADSQAIYGDLKAAIINGSLAAGSRLPTERALALQFDAARNTVRKTMNQLASEGLIARHVGRGTFVAKKPPVDARAALDEYSLPELLEARLLFEPNLPDLVVERATAQDIDAMEVCLDTMRQAVSWEEFKEAKYGLHLAIARGSRNRFIVSIFDQILASRRRSGWDRARGHPAPLAAVRETAYLDSRGIVEALKARDGNKARDAIRHYLLRTLSSASGN